MAKQINGPLGKFGGFPSSSELASFFEQLKFGKLTQKPAFIRTRLENIRANEDSTTKNEKTIGYANLILEMLDKYESSRVIEPKQTASVSTTPTSPLPRQNQTYTQQTYTPNRTSFGTSSGGFRNTTSARTGEFSNRPPFGTSQTSQSSQRAYDSLNIGDLVLAERVDEPRDIGKDYSIPLLRGKRIFVSREKIKQGQYVRITRVTTPDKFYTAVLVPYVSELSNHTKKLEEYAQNLRTSLIDLTKTEPRDEDLAGFIKTARELYQRLRKEVSQPLDVFREVNSELKQIDLHRQYLQVYNTVTDLETQVAQRMSELEQMSREYDKSQTGKYKTKLPDARDLEKTPDKIETEYVIRIPYRERFAKFVFTEETLPQTVSDFYAYLAETKFNEQITSEVARGFLSERKENATILYNGARLSATDEFKRAFKEGKSTISVSKEKERDIVREVVTERRVLVAEASRSRGGGLG